MFDINPHLTPIRFPRIFDNESQWLAISGVWTNISTTPLFMVQSPFFLGNHAYYVLGLQPPEISPFLIFSFPFLCGFGPQSDSPHQLSLAKHFTLLRLNNIKSPSGIFCTPFLFFLPMKSDGFWLNPHWIPTFPPFFQRFSSATSGGAPELRTRRHHDTAVIRGSTFASRTPDLAWRQIYGWCGEICLMPYYIFSLNWDVNGNFTTWPYLFF